MRLSLLMSLLRTFSTRCFYYETEVSGDLSLKNSSKEVCFTIYTMLERKATLHLS